MGQFDTKDVRADVIALVAVLAIVGTGAGLFFRTSPALPSPVVPIGLVAGMAVGIGCSRWWRAALVALLGVPGGFLITSLVARPAWHAGLFWLPNALQAAALAAVIGGAVCFVSGRSERLRPLMQVVAVVALIAAMWLSGLALAARVSKAADGITTYIPLETLAKVPALTRDSSDEDIYLNYLAHMRAGQPYYTAAASVLSEVNSVRPDSPINLKSPLAYRLPTLYVVLAQLPSPDALVNAILAMATLGVVAAFALARRFVSAVAAFAGASVVAAMFAGYTGPMLLDTELWAGIFGLCATALLVWALASERRSLALHAAAATCALLATSVRELAIAFLLVGLAAALADRREGSSRSWLPWAAGIAASVAVLAAHWVAARAASSGLPTPNTSGFPWFHPDGSGLISGVSLAATHLWVATGVVWLLVALGMLGSVLASRRLSTRIALAGVAVLGPIVLAFLHPPGWATYGVPGYWGDLVLPTALACAPLAFARLRGVGWEADQNAAKHTMPSDEPEEAVGDSAAPAAPLADTAPAPSAAPARGLLGEAAALLAIVLMASAGGGLFFRTDVYLTLGLVAGLVAGLSATLWWRAAAIAVLAVPIGFEVASLVASPQWRGGVAAWLMLAVQTVVVAGLVGAVVAYMRDRSPRLTPLLPALAVVVLVGSMWLSGQTVASTRIAQRPSPLERIAGVPQLNADSGDADIYLNYLGRMRTGESYYAAATHTITELNTVRPEGPIAIDSPLSYRLPTLYVVLSRMPSPASIVDLMLLLGGIGVVAAYLLGRQFVSPVPALVGATLVASMFSGYVAVSLLDTESWAGIFALCAVLLVVLARRHERRALLLHVGAAACALLAASVRELAVVFLLLGLAAALADRAANRRAWAPWAVAIALTAVGYGLHWRAAAAAYAGLTGPQVGGFLWFHPDGTGLLSAIGLLGTYGWLAAWFAGIFVAAGMAGALVAPRDWPARIMVTGTALCGPLVLLFFHPTGWARYGAAPGYWGDLVIPATLACAPLLLARVQAFRRADTPTTPAE